MNTRNKNHGPIGTKLGTFIVDDKLTIENSYVALQLYDKLLIDSITIGLKWIGKKLDENLLDNKYKRLYQKFTSLIETNGYTDELNQSIIEIAHDISSKINSVASKQLVNSATGSPRNNQKMFTGNQVSSSIKEFKFKPNHLGPDDLNNITDKDIDFSRGLMVQSLPGKYDLFLYVRHNDHFDLLPYEYITEKIKRLPQLIYQGMKIN